MKSMNAEEKYEIIEERNRIREAWFLFSRENAYGLIRWLCFAGLCYFSIAFFHAESITILGKACLLFTVSMIMEYFPLFSRYPLAAKYNSNRRILRQKRIITILFYGALVGLVLFSAFLAFRTPPSKLNLEVASRLFIGLYIAIFIYLLVNCIIGLCYVPEVSKKMEDRKERMYRAAEEGNLGNIPQSRG